MMKKLNRRTTIKAGAAAAVAPSLFSIARAGESANNKLNVGIVGAGGMGRMCVGMSWNQNIVAFADVDSVQTAETYKEHRDVSVFTDFRRMLDKHYKERDVVLISTPDHTHFSATLSAMERGLNGKGSVRYINTLTEIIKISD